MTQQRRRSIRAGVYRVAISIAAALVCGIAGGINAYLHPWGPSGKVPIPPTTGERVLYDFALLFAFGLIASLCVVSLFWWAAKEDRQSLAAK